ncbi:hypothetical protein MmiHf6_03530 [Methanimicrococcus hongohii]|uniref:DUF4325 domain-containing protein n=1 Tax=Methanimicrococcus hongohii TaxID=3028295 RepID=A0AA96V7R4_9EURY|nr:STAS-like domain-containing protein [Methanimicrococcus sp. Hf6]WNY23056.1 hypothetical protein MmiHf6_03530 [Methanimicrococcus sp. Hf6]
MKILVKEHISTGFTGSDADILNSLVRNAINNADKNNEPIIIDFEGIEMYATFFFNVALAPFLEFMSKKEYDSKIKVINLTSVGEAAYSLSYEGAVEYYSLTPEMRKAREEIHAEILEEFF